MVMQTNSEPRTSIVRDTFSMPESDHALLEALKSRIFKDHKRISSKSEIVRAGLRALAEMQSEEMAVALGRVERIKKGPSRGR